MLICSALHINIYICIHAQILYIFFMCFRPEIPLKSFSIFSIFFSLLKGFSLYTIYMRHRLTECLGCGPEHKASWQRQANLSSPLEGGLSRNKATRKLQQSAGFIYLFFSQGDSVIYKLNEWQSGQCQQPGAQWRLDCIYLSAQKSLSITNV